MEDCEQRIPIIYRVFEKDCTLFLFIFLGEKVQFLSNILYFFVVRQPHSVLGIVVHITRSHTVGYSKLGRTPLDEWSARRRDLYLTTHNTQNRKTSTLPTGFDPAVQAVEQPQTYAIDGAATWISCLVHSTSIYHQSRYSATNCGGQSVALYRGFSVYVTELSGCCLEQSVYFWKLVYYLRKCLYVITLSTVT